MTDGKPHPEEANLHGHSQSHSHSQAHADAHAPAGASDEAAKEAPEEALKQAPKGDKRERIVDALLALAAERPFGGIALRDVADRAGVTLGDFRDAFPSKGAVLAGYARRIDRAVLDAPVAFREDEAPRDRLFDVLMRRFDAMAGDKAALRSIFAWARREPLAATELNRLAVNSMRFMVEAAGLDSEGPLGAVKLQGLAVAYARVMENWLDDESADHAKTMAALDKALARGETAVARLDDAWRLSAPLRAFGSALFDAPRGFRERARGRADAS